jgi:GTPase SAR1 family protein
LQSQQYLQWKTSPKSSLWLYGFAGCGKTVLTSSIVEDLYSETSSDISTSSGPILLYFFFDFREVEKQSLEEMARSLAYQLYNQDKNFQQSLDSLLKACDDGYRKPTAEQLLGPIMEHLLAADSKVYVILDALDECTVPRQELLAWIEKVAERTSQKIHLLATSRKEPDIDSVLGRPNLMDQSIAVQTGVVDEDISAYILHRLRTDVGFKRWEHRKDIQQMIQESLMDMSDGM